MIDMSDPISRQQAITALRALSDDDGYINVPHEVVTDVVRGLPPVKGKQGRTVHSERGKTDKLGVKTSETYKDTISRQALCEYALNQKDKSVTPNDIMRFPSTQPEPMSESYMKAVWTWLLDYQIKTAELKGRYTPYEVLSWVANDWRKEHE